MNDEKNNEIKVTELGPDEELRCYVSKDVSIEDIVDAAAYARSAKIRIGLSAKWFFKKNPGLWEVVQTMPLPLREEYLTKLSTKIAFELGLQPLGDLYFPKFFGLSPKESKGKRMDFSSVRGFDPFALGSIEARKD
jgi:hypothetical protein